MKATHYIVLREEPLIGILSGKKKKEYRDSRMCKTLAGKTVALACARSSKTDMAGKIVCDVDFGEADVERWPWEDKDDPGEPFVNIVSIRRWKEEEWLSSPGGLGLRPIPKDPA